MARGAIAEVGAERWSPNGYLYRKTDDGWETVHRLLAEEKLGRPLNANEYATFMDGDKTNLDPENIIIKLRGRSSLRRRLIQVEDRLRELNAVRDDILARIEEQDRIIG
jgi:hypothetical protein